MKPGPQHRAQTAVYILVTDDNHTCLGFRPVVRVLSCHARFAYVPNRHELDNDMHHLPQETCLREPSRPTDQTGRLDLHHARVRTG